MEAQTKNCQNCKNNFIVDIDDFLFYEKIKVPAPTFCPECRLQRRMLWRNERTLYRRKCDAPNHEEFIVSIYPPDKKFPVYDSYMEYTKHYGNSIIKGVVHYYQLKKQNIQRGIF
jgi:hypothetical protein